MRVEDLHLEGRQITRVELGAENIVTTVAKAVADEFGMYWLGTLELTFENGSRLKVSGSYGQAILVRVERPNPHETRRREGS